LACQPGIYSKTLSKRKKRREGGREKGREGGKYSSDYFFYHPLTQEILNKYFQFCTEMFGLDFGLLCGKKLI
jgi:hypothetical protein